MIEKLLPCPFCGGTPELVNKTDLEFSEDKADDIWDIQCRTKDCFLEFGADWFDAKSDIIAMWNKRG